MGTEKSLLTYESFRDSIKKLSTDGGIKVPIGVTPGGSLECVNLLDSSENSNMLALGVTGSGKTKFVEFVVTSLCELYGNSLRISYIDGKDCEIRQWAESNSHGCRIPNPRALTACTSVGVLTDIVGMFADLSSTSEFKTHEFVVFDDIGYLIDDFSEKELSDFKLMLRTGPSAGIHYMFTQQSSSGPVIELGKYFDLICTTRVNSKVSEELYGNNIGTLVRKYGDVVYNYCGNQSKLRVPFVETMH